jgi:regulatory protein
VRAGIIDELEQAGLIDDARFAREFVSVRKDTRLVGPHRLRADLAKLGLNRVVVERALASYSADEQEARARELVERTARGVIDEKTVRRVVALLKRKGYDYSVVNRVAYDLVRKIPRASDDAADNIPDEW